MITTLPAAEPGNETEAYSTDHVRTLVAVLVAAYAYTIACTPAGWSFLAWLVPGILLLGLSHQGAAGATLYGALFAFLCGARFAENMSGNLVSVTAWEIAEAAIARAADLALGALPFGLFGWIYAQQARKTPAAARSSLVAWAWVGCELLRSQVSAATPWTYLGESQEGSTLFVLGGTVLSFVMVLVSSAVAEAVQVRGRIELRPLELARWAALPAAALLALFVIGARTSIEGHPTHVEAFDAQPAELEAPINPAQSYRGAVPLSPLSSGGALLIAI